MRNKNEDSTRYYSDAQEKSVCKIVNGYQTSNSGAGKFAKSDVFNKDASLSVECKTCMTDKESFSVKKEWLEKHKDEAFANRLDNTAIAFSFGPNQKNYFIIDEKLMKFLVEKLEEENS